MLAINQSMAKLGLAGAMWFATSSSEAQVLNVEALDSHNVLPALLGESKQGREHLIEHAGGLSLRKGNWKLIESGKGPKVNPNTRTEMGTDPQAQLYDLAADPGETRNIATQHPDLVKEMTAKLNALRDAGRLTTPKKNTFVPNSPNPTFF